MIGEWCFQAGEIEAHPDLPTACIWQLRFNTAVNRKFYRAGSGLIRICNDAICEGI